MSKYHAKPFSNSNFEAGENILVWFGDASIEGCDNALVLYGGDVLLLKTVGRVKREEIVNLIDDYQKWIERFGTGNGSSELRQAVREIYKTNDYNFVG